MSLNEKIKEQVAQHLVIAVLAPFLFLAGVLWSAIPYQVWDQLSGLTPKKALWALLGILVLTSLGLTAYVFVLRRRLKNKLRPMYGVLWDREANAYCPGCNSALAAYQERAFGMLAFRCTKCKTELPLRDDEGKDVTLLEAKRVLAATLQ